MSYQEFINELLLELRKHLPLDTELKVQSIIKNNNLHLDGLSIMKPESNVSPTFYLNYYYDEYKECHDIARIAQLILQTYDEQEQIPNIDINFFTDLETIRPNIVYKIVNFSMNKELLKDIPHIPYLDLAIVFYCLINNEHFQNASILIKNQHLEHWNITDRQLYDIAIHNTPSLLPSKFMHIRELIDDYEPTSELDSLFQLQFSDLNYDEVLQPNMYVLSNNSKLFGAASILYPDLLEGIAMSFRSSLYILPSSIHEVILIPGNDKSQLKFYTEMVQEVNATHVLDEDILSDHAYYYDYKEKALLYI